MKTAVTRRCKLRTLVINNIHWETVQWRLEQSGYIFSHLLHLNSSINKPLGIRLSLLWLTAAILTSFILLFKTELKPHVIRRNVLFNKLKQQEANIKPDDTEGASIESFSLWACITLILPSIIIEFSRFLSNIIIQLYSNYPIIFVRNVIGNRVWSNHAPFARTKP